MQKVFQRCFEAIHSHTMVRQLDQNVPGKIGEGSPAGYTHPRERGSKAYQGPADIITSDVVETVASVAETSSKVRARGFIKNSVTRDFKVSGFCRNFSKNVVITFKLNFFRISGIPPLVMVVSCLQIQQTKCFWMAKVLLSHILAIFKVSRQ